MKFIILMIFLFLLLIPLAYADTTFFDNEEDVFIIGNPLSGEITEIIKENGLNKNGECLTNWVCNSWSTCINEIQQRNCTKEKSYCYADLNKKPLESQGCSIKTGKQNETQEPPQNKEKDKKIKNFIILLIILVIIIFFAYKISRKMRNSKYGF